MLLDYKSLCIKRRKRALGLSTEYEIFDADSDNQIAFAKEENSIIVRILTILLGKIKLSSKVSVYDFATDACFFVIKNTQHIVKSGTSVFDSENKYLGCFNRKLFNLTDFDIIDSTGKQIAQVVGDLSSRNYQIISNDKKVLCIVTKKWEGFLNLLLHGSNTYMVDFNPNEHIPDDIKRLIFAGSTAIAVIFKGRG